MNVRIGIPEPTSLDTAYNGRCLPQYIAALQAAGAKPVVIPLHEEPAGVARLLAGIHGVLLPGSKYDLDPESYGEKRSPAWHESDAGRTAVDELLLQDAFNLRKPVFGICGGMQALNVWRNGTLVQDLPASGKRLVNHSAGADVEHAHEIRIEHASRLATIAPPTSAPVSVNSSHHQAVRRPGDNLRIAAACPDDGVIEAIELHSPDHFVLGVQWHPERSYGKSPLSRALFGAFVREAQAWAKRHPEAGEPA